MKDFLPASRYLVILAVAGCFIAAAALFGYGLIAVIRIVVQTVAADLAGVSRANRDVVSGAEHLAVDLIQMTDVFLLGTVIYLVGLGLHLLFINPRLPARPWTAVEDLEGLKEMLVRVIILLVGVTFLGAFVEHADNTPVRDLSISAAVVVFAFSLVVLVDKLPNWSRGNNSEASPADPETPAQG